MLDIRNLRYSFGKREILSGIDLHIGKGSFHALMGANGSGKTTLLRCLGNLLDIPYGTVFVGNTDIKTMSSRQTAQQIAYVSQQSTSDVDFSAFEIVLMGRNPYQSRLQNESRRDWEIVEECMMQTNTWHLRFSSLSQMSGGERQRVMIARALAQQTPILLLDEPLSNLDIAHQFEILSILTRINREQDKTIILIIHDLNLALKHCPDLLLLNGGKIIFNGRTREGLDCKNIKDVFGVDSSLETIAGEPVILVKKTTDNFPEQRESV